MRALSPASLEALSSQNIKVRDFIWFVVRERGSGNHVTAGFWSDVGTFNAQVIDPETRATVSRSYEGAGTLISVSPVPLISNLTVQSVTIELSQVSDASALIRGYDAKQARVELHRGLFAPDTLEQIGPAYPRFFGFVDDIEVKTPRENEEGGIVLTCVSHTQELTRSNPATRSDAYQRRRDPNDSFRRHAAAVANWDIKWGAKS